MGKFEELYESITDDLISEGKENAGLMGPDGTHSIGQGFYGHHIGEAMFKKAGGKFVKVNKGEGPSDEHSGHKKLLAQTAAIGEDDWAARHKIYQLVGKADAHTLHKLADHKNFNVRQAVASSSETHPDTLRKLADDKNEHARREVLMNPKTPQDVLRKAAKHHSQYVRYYVAGNPNAHPDDLHNLANEKSHHTRSEVASNPNTSEKTLLKLADDTNNIVKTNVADHPNATERVLNALLKHKREGNQDLSHGNVEFAVDIARKKLKKKLEKKD